MTVLHPGEPAYARCLASLANRRAGDRRPERIHQPASTSEVAAILREAAARGASVQVCGGGSSDLCSRDGGWMLDLRSGFASITLPQPGEAPLVRVGGGVSTAELVSRLAGTGRTVPAGLSGVPGMGYVLSGGIGPLGRIHGLAIDTVVALEGVRGDGRMVRETLTPDRRDAVAWALRGAAPFLAVVTGLTLRTVPARRLHLWRALLPDRALAPLHRMASGLPRTVSLQWILEPDALYVVAVSEADPGPLQELQDRLTAPPECRALWQERSSVAGQEALPPFRRPGGEAPPSGPEPEPLHRAVIGLLQRRDQDLSGREEELAGVLRRLTARRPHPACGIASQQMGGAMARSPAGPTAFRHRSSSWKPWITAAWPAGDDGLAARAQDWLEHGWDALTPFFAGIHLAQHRPGTARHGEELRRAYGPDLATLARLKGQWDPAGVLPAL